MGIGDRWEKGGVLEGKKRVRKVRDGLTDAVGGGKRDEDIEATIV